MNSADAGVLIVATHSTRNFPSRFFSSIEKVQNESAEFLTTGWLVFSATIFLCNSSEQRGGSVAC